MRYIVKIKGNTAYEYTLDEIRNEYRAGKLDESWPVRSEKAGEWGTIRQLLESHGETLPPKADFSAQSTANSSRESSEPVHSGFSDKVIKRYKDAYLVARTVNWFGGIIKALGAILAVIVILPSLMMIGQNQYRPFSFLGIIFGIFVGVLLYLLGVIVSAQGQILMASLDGAVNSSPFLTNVQKGEAMSL